MKKAKLDFTFWFKVIFLLVVISGYLSLKTMEPIKVQSVGRTTDQAMESGFKKASGFIAVKNSSIMSGNDGSTWVYLVNGSTVKKTLVKLGESNKEYVEVTSGLLLKDAYILNPSKKNAEREEFPVNWRFDY